MNNTISLQQIGSGERRLFVDLETPDTAVVPSLISDQENQLQRTRFGSVGSKLLLATSGVVALEMTAGTLFDNSHVYAQEAPKPSQDTESPPMSVFFTGDSLTEGRVIYGDLEKKLTEAGIQVFEVQYKSGIPVSKGTEYLRQHPEEVGEATTVVLALGTNDSNVGSFKQDLLEAGRVAQQIGVAPDGVAPIIVIPDIFGNSSRIQADSKNNGIDEVVAQLSSEGIRVVNIPYKDYVDTVVRQEGAVAGDEIHLTGKGYDLLTDFDALNIQSLTVDYYNELHPQQIPAAEPQIAPEPIDNTITINRVADIDIISPETIRNIEVGDSGQPMVGTRRALPNDFSITPIGLINSKVNFDYTNEDLIGAITTVQPKLVDLVEIPVISDQQIANESSQTPINETGTQLSGPAVISLPSLQSLNPSEKAPDVVLADIASKIPENTTQPQEAVESVGVVEEIDFKSKYSIINGVIDDSKLKEFIINRPDIFAKATPSNEFPEGDYYRIPDSLPGVGYYFVDDITGPNERFASVEIVALAIILADYNEFRGLPPKYYQDATSTHGEHRNGGDIDTGLAPTETDRLEELKFLTSLRKLDGSEYLHHIVTGDQWLDDKATEYRNSLGYNRPNIITQIDHGTEPGNGAHLHLSIDGGAGGPFAEPAANVPVTWGNHPAQAPAIGGEYSPETNTSVSAPKFAVVDFEITDTSQVVIPNVEPASGNINNIIKKQNNRGANNGVIADPISNGVDNKGVNPQNNASINNDTTKPLDLPNVEEGVNISNGVGVDENGEVIVDISKLPETSDSNLSQTEDSVLVSETENVTIASDDESEPVQDPQPVELPVGESEPEPIPQQTEPTPEPMVDPNDATLGAVPQEIYDTLRGPDFGYTHAGAIGWMANFALESGLNPTRTQISWNGNCAPAPERLNPEKRGAPEGTKGQGFGLGQWTLKERQQELQKVADKAGVPWTNLQLQLGHARNEAEYYGINNELRSTEDITAATILVLAKFENPQAYIDGGSAREGVINERVNRALELNDQISRGDFASIDVACD